MSDLIRLLSVQVWQLSQEIRDVARPTLDELGLTGPLAELVWVLDPGAPRTMRELAELLRCDASNLTFLADRLEERKLAARESHPTDRRARVLALTPAGVKARARLMDATLEETPFARLSPAEQQALRKLLAKLVPELGPAR